MAKALHMQAPRPPTLASAAESRRPRGDMLAGKWCNRPMGNSWYMTYAISNPIGRHHVRPIQ